MFRIPGPRKEPGGRLKRGRNPAAAARAARSAKRKMSVILELLRGADLESTSRKYGVTAATLSEWRDAFLAAGAEGLKIRQEDLFDEQGRRMKSVIAELAMENEILRERIRRVGDERRSPDRMLTKTSRSPASAGSRNARGPYSSRRERMARRATGGPLVLAALKARPTIQSRERRPE